MSAIILFATLSQITNPTSLAAKPVPKVSPPAIVRLQNFSNQPVNAQEQLQQGIKLYQQEQFSEAAQILQQASEAFKTAGDGLNEALTLNYLSYAYQQLGQLPDAQGATNRSLALLQNQDGFKEYLKVRAQALNTQGKLQLAQGKAETALKTWEEATKVYQKAGDEAGVIGSQINQTQALQTLGFYRRAQNILENLENSLEKQPNSLLKIKELLSLGNTQRVIGKIKKSQEVLEQAKKLAEQLRSAMLPLSPQLVAETLLSLGNTYQTLANNENGQNNQAEEFTQKALEAYSEAAEISISPTIKVQAQLNKLRLLVDKGNKEQLLEAQKLWTQLPSELEQLPLSRQKVYARINLAQSLIKIREIEVTKVADNKSEEKLSPNPSWLQVAEIVKTGVEEAKTLEDNRAQAYALGTLGSLYEKTAQFSEAQKLSEQAVQLAEGISASDIAYRWRWQLGRIYKARGNSEQAKGAYKQAINHLKSLRNDIASISRDVQFSFREEVEPVYREYVSLLLPQTASTQASQANLKEARDVMESLKIAELDNFFRRACLDVEDKPVSLNEIDPTAAVIYPIILPDRLAVIVSLSNQQSKLKQDKEEQKEILKLEQHFFKKGEKFYSENDFTETVNNLREEKLVSKHTTEDDYLPVLQKIMTC
ncbi:MAG: hypothetical protein HC815_09180 [Richelia sp. RM1_1_1]|nr:hypothetical protein [Richelia sp. RM1_1_1]